MWENFKESEFGKKIIKVFSNRGVVITTALVVLVLTIAITATVATNRANIDMDGVTIQEMAKVVAGNTRPFVRLTGAPYWEGEGRSMNAIIECNRTEIHWFKGWDIETMAEGDTFPRPRNKVPAAYLEILDQILRADGNSDGILKYMNCYDEGVTYEEGYILRHVRNQKKHEQVAELFAGKKEVEGPLSHTFDIKCRDTYFGQKTWEQAEKQMMVMLFCRHMRHVIMYIVLLLIMIIIHFMIKKLI